MTLFALRSPADLLAVRFASSPVWETSTALLTFLDDRLRAHHRPWHDAVRERAARLDLTPLFAVLPLGGWIPDFVAPPPRVPRPRLRDQLAEIRATPLAQVVRELERCRATVAEPRYRRVVEGFLVQPERARELIAARLHQAWAELLAPFWPRIRTLLDRDIEERARTIARHGLRRALDELHPRIRWTKRGVSCADRTGRTVELDERGLVLMPSAFLGPVVAAIVEEPWQPTIAYGARGVAELWRAPSPPPDGLSHLLGKTRALVLASLDEPRSTTALAALLELSPAGVSRHLLALRDAGLVATTRRGHEVLYRRSRLGSALLRVRRPGQESGPGAGNAAR